MTINYHPNNLAEIRAILGPLDHPDAPELYLIPSDPTLGN